MPVTPIGLFVPTSLAPVPVKTALPAIVTTSVPKTPLVVEVTLAATLPS